MTNSARIPGNTDLLKHVSFRRALSNHLRDDGYLPEPWVFPPIFSFRRANGNLNGDCTKRPQAVLHAPKSGFGWRDFGLVHPNNYLSVVGALGTKEFESAFRNAASQSPVTSFSMPQMYSARPHRVRQDLERWGAMQAAIRSLAHSHPFMGLADVSSCYHTVYSHAVAWALEESMDPGNVEVGSRLDKALSSGNLGRTHGIAVGPRVSDFVVELLLLHVDGMISLPRNVRAFRFRDNYYFVATRAIDVDRAIAELSKSLRESHLSINATKTERKSTRDYVTRGWGHDYKRLCYTVGVNIDAIADGTPTMLRASTVAGFINGAILLSAEHDFKYSVAERAIADLERSGFAASPPNDHVLDLLFILARTRTKVLPFALSFLTAYVSNNVGARRRVRDFILSVAASAKSSEDWFSFSWAVYFHLILTGRAIRKSICDGVSDPLAACVIEYCSLVSNGQDVATVVSPLWGRIPRRVRGSKEYDSGERDEVGYKLIYAEPLDADGVAALLGPRFTY